MKVLIPLSATRKDAAFNISKRELVVHCGRPNKASSRWLYAVNLSNMRLTKHIPEDAKLLDEELIRVIYTLYRYTLRVGDSRELRKFQFLEKSTLPGIRDSVFASEDMLLYKLATLSCIMQKLVPNKHLDRVQAVFRSYGLTKDDATLYCLLYHNGDIVELIKQLKSVDEGCHLTVESLQKEVSTKDFTKKIDAVSKATAYRKLRFIYEGNRLSIDDMVNELKMRAIQAYYWVRPFYSKLHATNYAIHSVQKQAQNVIRHYTTPERARVIRDEETGGFTNVVQDFGNLVPSDGFNEDAMLMYLDLKRGGAIAYEAAA